MSKKYLIIIMTLLALSAIGLRAKQLLVEKQATATIKDQTLAVDIAANEPTRIRGLGGRLELPAKSGMVFIFDKPERYNFWMQGMFFPIDIIWINNGRVVDLTENAPAPSLGGQFNLPLYSPREPANVVLEVNAGFAKKYNITVGDPFFIKY